MSINLLDAYAIVAFMPTGMAVKDIDSPKYLKSINDNILSYGSFIYSFHLSTDWVNDDEHAAFLLNWLFKYVFIHPALRVSKDPLGIAFSLADGMSIALGPLIVVALYRGITDASLAMHSTIFGSFWLFLVWIALYFLFLFSNRSYLWRPESATPCLWIHRMSIVESSLRKVAEC